MIEFKQGNLFDENAEAVVNTVNCVGVMGKSIAVQFKQAFPENFAQYKRACTGKAVQPGRMFIVRTGRLFPQYIINFPTKRHWKEKSRLEDIKVGLVALVAETRKLVIKSLAIPPLCCGNGGLAWSEVKPLTEEAFSILPDVRAIVFEPQDAPATD
jgi:O-acetyl-ADP-ribose deacetylase (regulator of RNase III)